jgi:hypothetical protein
VISLERRDPSEGGYGGGSFSEAGAAPADAPVARPRGAAAPAGGSNADSIDVDDIPF